MQQADKDRYIEAVLMALEHLEKQINYDLPAELFLLQNAIRHCAETMKMAQAIASPSHWGWPRANRTRQEKRLARVINGAIIELSQRKDNPDNPEHQEHYKYMVDTLAPLIR